MSGPIPVPLLSIDPSSTHVGWALLGPGGSYLASSVQMIPGMTSDDRVPATGQFVQHLMSTYNPASFLIERPDYIREDANKQNLILFFNACGAAHFAASQFGRPIYLEKASKYKEHTLKRERMERFQRIVGRPPLRHDESDAYVMGFDFLLSRSVLVPQPVPPL